MDPFCASAPTANDNSNFKDASSSSADDHFQTQLSEDGSTDETCFLSLRKIGDSMDLSTPNCESC